VCKNITQQQAFEYEKELIEVYKTTNPLYGYNVSIGGDKCLLGFKHSEESKKKMRDSHMGQTPYNKGLKMPIETRNKLSISHIGKKQTKETIKKRISKTATVNKGRKNTDSSKQRMRDARKDKKIVYQYSQSNELINVFESIREAERKTGIQHTHISRCCRGIERQAGGFIWKFKED